MSICIKIYKIIQFIYMFIITIIRGYRLSEKIHELMIEKLCKAS